MASLAYRWTAGQFEDDAPTVADWRDYETWAAREEALAEDERHEGLSGIFGQDLAEWVEATSLAGHGYGPDVDGDPGDERF